MTIHPRHDPDDLRFSALLLENPLIFHTTRGLFSPEAIDAGSQLLLRELGDVPPQARVFDLGCGYGALGLAIAKAYPSAHVTLADTDFLAVECAQRNASENHLANTTVQLSNGFRHLPADEKFDLIVSNLPAKVGRDLTLRFFTDAQTHLTPEGRIVVVTVLGLKEFVKRSFKEIFGNYKKLKQGATHVVAQARLTPLSPTEEDPE